jgi:hypothetical protein
MRRQPWALATYAIYFNPSDYPGRYVARRWDVGPAGEMTACPKLHANAPDLESVRDTMPTGTVRVHRAMTDDPCIVEAWI